MTSQRSVTGEDLYVVRVRRDVPSATLRGYVDAIGTNRRLYFTSVDDLSAFFEHEMSRPSPQGTTP